MTEVIRIWNDHIDNNCKKTYRRINILINKLSSFCWNNDSLFFVWNRRICAHDLDYTSLLWKSRRIFFNAAFSLFLFFFPILFCRENAGCSLILIRNNILFWQSTNSGLSLISLLMWATLWTEVKILMADNIFSAISQNVLWSTYLYLGRKKGRIL